MAKSSPMIILMVTILVVSCDGMRVGRTNPPRYLEVEQHLERLNKPPVKTIKSNDGDIIDCIDIYKQPAFDHPNLKNHTIQMRPSFSPKVDKNNSSLAPPMRQAWLKSGSCPQGTIPILRTQKTDLLRAPSLESYGRITAPGIGSVEKAGAYMADASGPYHGVRAQINVWSLHVEPNEWSHNSILVIRNGGSYAEAGWGVNPIVFKDNQTRLFTYWTDDDNRKTGCYNLLCPGFVQVSRRIALGARIAPLSTYKGQQYFIELIIYKVCKNGLSDMDNVQLKWWLLFGDEPVGYWPVSIFINFSEAREVQWMGSVLNTHQNGGQHTTTQMGSGHFPEEGYGGSSYFANVLVMNVLNNFVPAEDYNLLEPIMKCYGFQESSNRHGRPGSWFFYGGPGGPSC